MSAAKWYKGNLHMHSFWSDGLDFPEMIARWFKDRGYHFIAFTEHDRLQTGECWVTRDPNDEVGRTIDRYGLLEKYLEAFGGGWVERRTLDGHEQIRLRTLDEYRGRCEEPGAFLIMTGEEITTRWNDGGGEQVNYINALNQDRAIPPPPVAECSADAMCRTIAACDEEARRSGRNVLVSLNHPNWQWNAVAEDIAAARPLRFMEIHTALNTCRDMGDAHHAATERLWDIVLTRRLGEMGADPIYGLVTDDSHCYSAGHPRMGDWALPGRAWVMVRAPELSAPAVVAALGRGDFYGSSGVTLGDVRADASGLRLATEPENGERLVTRFIGTRRGYDPASEPVLDDDGRPVRTTARYSDEIGRVLAESTDREPVYTFDGDELYVRAVVESDREHHNPSYPGQKLRAWTQPVMPTA